MVRDIREEEKQIRNGNRFMTETTGRGVFPRDVDKLLIKYSNLRRKVYSTFERSFPDEATRKELKSYIDEQFIKLTKEYDINGAVDFPGYIKKSLNLRVKHGFVGGRYRDNGREKLGVEDGEVENMLKEDIHSLQDIDDKELMNYILSGAELNPLQMDILKELLENQTVSRSRTKQLGEEYGVKSRDVTKETDQVKEYLYHRLKK